MMVEPQWRFTEQENRLKTIKITIMKKLFTFFAIILSIGIANAQTKKPVATTNTDATTVTKEPSLEETVEYKLPEFSVNGKIADVDVFANPKLSKDQRNAKLDEYQKQCLKSKKSFLL